MNSRVSAYEKEVRDKVLWKAFSETVNNQKYLKTLQKREKNDGKETYLENLETTFSSNARNLGVRRRYIFASKPGRMIKSLSNARFRKAKFAEDALKHAQTKSGH